MSHQALYRQYRPLTFENVVEQQHIVTTLKNTVLSKKIGHAYLFCGTRGTGKTTMAKIFARAVNCLKPTGGNPCNHCEVCEGILNNTILDVYEIDAASNNSVDNVRDIINEVKYAPTRAEYKVYIIDEVHMLSAGAFNALLKTLEEPPVHVLFILATTEPHKLPATVLSRCQRYDFKRISVEGIKGRLLLIAKEAGVSVTEEAARFIASLAEGALRDGISILDQCIATGEKMLDLGSVHEIIGVASGKFIMNTVGFLIERNAKESIDAIDRLFSDGKDPGQFLQRIIQLFRDILVFKTSKSPELLLCMTEEEKKAIPVLSVKLSAEEILAIVRELSELEAGIKWSSSPRVLVEMAFLRICTRELDKDKDTLTDRLHLLEDRIRRLEEGNSPVSGKQLSEPSGYEIKGNSQKIQESVSHDPELQDAEPVILNSRKSEQVCNSDKKQDRKNKEAENDYKGQKSFSEWGRVLEELKNSGRMKLFSSLAEAPAVLMDEDTVGIILPEEEQFTKSVMAKSENIEAVTYAIKRCTGKTLNVRIIHFGKRNRKTEEKEVPDTVLQFARQKGIKLDIVD